EAGNLNVTQPQDHAGKNDKPVVLHVNRIADSNQRQLLGARVSHVRADIEKIFKEEKSAKGSACGLEPPHKVDRKGKGHEQLEDGDTPYHQGFAEIAEQEMASLVNDEVGIINKEIAAAVKQGV